MKTALKFLLFLGVLSLMPSAFADDNVQFHYQSRVLLFQNPFSSEGRVKFALVNANGTVSLWSNDSSSVGGSEPTGSVPVTIDKGMLDIMVGDPDAGMDPLPGILFNRPDEVKLRIWFSDGQHSFHRLTPDRRIPTPKFLRLTEVTDPLTLYVNAVTGNDQNSGLAADKAKKTIQSAVSMLPKHLCNDVTIQIADGVYKESLVVSNILADARHSLTLVGDTETTNLESNDLKVIVDGEGTRNIGLDATGSVNLVIKGIQFSKFTSAGVNACKAECTFTACRVTNSNYNGFVFNDQCGVYLNDCVAKSNPYDGFIIWYNSNAHFNNCSAIDNGHVGANIQHCSFGKFDGTGNFSRNAAFGMWVYHGSGAWFDSITYHGQINDNGVAGIAIYWTSNVRYYGLNSFANNPSGSTWVQSGCRADQ